MKIYRLAALETNYFWLLQPDAEHPDAYIFDPGDAAPVLAALKQYDLTLAGIVLTHHHWDHTDGVDGLLQQQPVPVYGPDSARIAQVTQPLYNGDTLNLGSSSWQVIATPGHTLDHLVYYCPEPEGILIAGDTLFAAGCGRMFEGTPEVFFASLLTLAQLPSNTQLYCSHEYTQDNLAFASAVEPHNTAIAERLESVRQLRQRGESSVPSTLATELATNPFLRCDQASVMASARAHSGQPLVSTVEVFAALRGWKDNFRPN